MDKRLIRESFSRSAGVYDDHSVVQAAVAAELAELLRRARAANTAQGERAAVGAIGTGRTLGSGRVLDVGCGTGTLTGHLAEACPGYGVTALDIALPMAERTRARGVASGVVAGDCDELPFADAAFDVVASNMAYQWSGCPQAAFTEAARVLVAPGGLLVFSTLGPGTFAELNRCIAEAGARSAAPSAGFAPAEALRSALVGADLDVASFEVRPMVRTYRDMWDLLRKVKRIGASPGSPETGTAVLRAAARIYAERFPSEDGDGIRATYEVIYAVAARSS